MAGLKLERFARTIAMHDAVCDGVLSPAEWTVRPQQDATIALACGTCGQDMRLDEEPLKSHLAMLVDNATRIDAKRKRSGYVVGRPLGSGKLSPT